MKLIKCKNIFFKPNKYSFYLQIIIDNQRGKKRKNKQNENENENWVLHG